MNTLATIVTDKRMGSLEIAELMEKNHRDVMRDIRKLIKQEVFNERNFALISRTDKRNRKKSLYMLDFQATMILITGYDAKRRALIIDRWLKLESGEAEPACAKHRLEQPPVNALPPIDEERLWDYPLTFGQRRELIDFIRADVAACGYGPSKSNELSIGYYRALREHFMVATYKDIPASRFDDAMGVLRRHGGHVFSTDDRIQFFKGIVVDLHAKVEEMDKKMTALMQKLEVTK